MKRLSVFTLIAALCFSGGVATSLLTTNEARAYAVTGCRYKPDSISPITFRFFSVESAALIRATKFGTTAWNNTAAPGYFSEASTSIDPEVNVTANSYSHNSYAWITGPCPDGYFSGNEVNFIWNTRLALGRTGPQKDRIATHELGHAYGLGHVTTGCRIMRADIGYLTDCTMTTPQPDDIAGVKKIYPEVRN